MSLVFASATEVCYADIHNGHKASGHTWACIVCIGDLLQKSPIELKEQSNLQIYWWAFLDSLRNNSLIHPVVRPYIPSKLLGSQ